MENYRESLTERAELASSGMRQLPYWLSNIEWSALKAYSHKQHKQILHVLLMYLAYICICTHIHICTYMYIHTYVTIEVRKGAGK